MFSVMPGLVPGIHALLLHVRRSKTWMAGTSPALTIVTTYFFAYPHITNASFRQAGAMQVRAMGVEPGLGALGVGADPEDRAPEALRMIHLDEMRDLVRRQIVEHEGRRQDEAPGVGQHAGRRARAPAARLVADRHALDRDAELGGVAAARRLEIAP